MSAQPDAPDALHLEDTVRLIERQISGIEAVLRELYAARDMTVRQIQSGGRPQPRSDRIAYGGVKDEILALLSTAATSLTARQIIAELRVRGAHNERSIRNALSRLKAAGHVQLDGRSYRSQTPKK